MGTGLNLQDCPVGTKSVGNTGNAGYGNQPTVLLSGYQMWWGIPQNYNTEICGPYIVGAMFRKYKALCTLYIFIFNKPYIHSCRAIKTSFAGFEKEHPDCNHCKY